MVCEPLLGAINLVSSYTFTCKVLLQEILQSKELDVSPLRLPACLSIEICLRRTRRIKIRVANFVRIHALLGCIERCEHLLPLHNSKRTELNDWLYKIRLSLNHPVNVFICSRH